MSVDTNNAEFQDALNLIQYTRQSVFLTGKAGTGKSTFLRYVCEHTKKKHVVLAPTGIAAINAGGSTMHSFFKLPFYPLLPDDPNLSLQRGRIHEFFKYTKPHRKLLEQIELVIIDEISMVRADIIDAIDRILRVYSHNLREPFGGKQLLLVGDVFQLEPVVKNDEREILNRFYPTPYFFSARVFGQIDLVSIELQKVYRQTDPVFVSVLDHIRTNTARAADLQLLNTRYGSQIEESEADMYITLATRRDTVDSINEKKLAELPGDSITFEGVIEGDFPESSLPTSQELVLKPGAQIIFIKNDFDRRWVNGTIGVIAGIDEEEETIYVITDDGKTTAYYVNKDGFIIIPEFLTIKSSSDTRLSIDTTGYEIEGKKGTWLAQDYILMNEKKWFLMEHEEYGTRAAYVILSEEGAVVMNDCYNGFDEEARRNIQNFMQQQAEQAQQKQQEMQAQSQIRQQQSGETQKKKPELANWQKVMDNGEYLRSAEMAEEANYNMIDGLMNNIPRKKDKNAPRRSVLKRLRKHQQKIASQDKGQPQQQRAVEEEMERKKK